MVDSTPTRHGPPSSTRSTASPRSATTSAAVVGLTRPKRLADGRGHAVADRLEQLQGERVVGHPQADGVTAAGDGVGRLGAAPQQHGERARPEGVGQQVGLGRHDVGPGLDQVGLAEVHDQRMVGGPPLAAKIRATAAGSVASAPRP